MCVPAADLIAEITARGYRQDFEARTLAFFATAACVGFDRTLLQLQRRLAEAAGKVNVRLCMHGAPSDDFHDMLILEWPGSRYYRPHRHLEKGETIHLIEGRAAALVFDDSGALAQVHCLGVDNDLVVRIAPGHWHVLMPLSAPVIYHESKKGPFVRDEDSHYPVWAPDGADAQEARRYHEQLLFHAGLA